MAAELAFSEGIRVANILIDDDVAVGTSSMVAEGYDRYRHYCCGIVELDEGLRVSAHILGVDVQDPSSIEIGTPVTIEFPEGEGKPMVLTFRAMSSRSK
jgi:uncharacterized OB-fold protein